MSDLGETLDISNDNVPDEKLSNFRFEVNEFRKDTFLTQNKLAERADVTASLLSQVLGGRYRGNRDEVINKVLAYIRKEKSNLQKKIKSIPFVETSIFEKICDILNIADIDKKIVVLTGDTGIGKSFALREYCKQTPSAILISVDDSYRYDTPIRDIAEKLKLDTRGNIDRVMKRVVEALKDTGRMLIIDEAERLPLKGLSILRSLHDKTGIPIAIVGLQKLYDDIIVRNDMRQVYSRMQWAKLDKLSKKDVSDIIKTVFDNVSNDVLDTFFDISKGYAVYVTSLIRMTQRIMLNKNCELDVQAVITASGSLFTEHLKEVG